MDSRNLSMGSSSDRPPLPARRTLMQSARHFMAKMRTSDTLVIAALFSLLRHRLGGRSLVAHQRAMIRGASNIVTRGLLQVGVDPVGFCHRYDRTYLNIKGRLEFSGPFSIGRGCRFDIGPDAVATFGPGSITADTRVIISSRLDVGSGTIIAWGCQLLDNDFHALEYEGRRAPSFGIRIGSKVWIGSNVTILGGSVIPDGCVVAAGSVVTKAFEESRSLIGGNPACVLRRNVDWY